MNLPNLLSLIRLAMVPGFAVVYLSDMRRAGLIAGIIFIAAAATDVVDGYLARKWNQVTKLGRVLDPLADKLLQATALACLTVKKVVPVPVCVIFVVKELLMLIGGTLMVKKTDDVMGANRFGKGASFLISAILVFSILFKNNVETKVTNYLFYLVAALAVATFAVYAFLCARHIKQKKTVKEQ